MRSRSNSSSISQSLTHPDSDLSKNQPITLQHFNLLMNQMQSLIASVDRVEKRQDDLFTQLAVCTSTLNDHSRILSEQQSSLEKCFEDVITIGRSQAALSDDLSAMRERVTTLESGISSLSGPCSGYSEVLERFKKSHNIIVVGAPESGDSSQDMVLAREIIDHIHKPSSSGLVGVARLRAGDTSRPRWLRVSFSSPDAVTRILRNKLSLRGVPQFRNISIRDDKTREQINELTSLRGELKMRQSKGEGSLTIKYVNGCPKIVNTTASASRTSSTKN